MAIQDVKQYAERFKPSEQDIKNYKRKYGNFYDWGMFSIDLDKFCLQRRDKEAYFNNKVSLIGCQGVAGFGSLVEKDLYKAGPAIQRYIGHQATHDGSTFNMLLGDNIYDDGPICVDDPRMQSVFERVYLKQSFCLLGNHDAKIHGGAIIGHSGDSFSAKKKIMTGLKNLAWFRGKKDLLRVIFQGDRAWEKTMERAMREVRYTYSSTMNTNNRWNMPFRYYYLISHRKKTVFICLDSNTFPFDYPQQEWLEHIYDGFHDYKKVLAMHHPIISAGKRLTSTDDAAMYAQSFGITSFAMPHNEMGQSCAHTLNKLGTNKFDFVVCAHDHLMLVEQLHEHYSGDMTSLPGAIQIISGGGGAPLSIVDEEMGEDMKRDSFSGSKIKHSARALSARAETTVGTVDETNIIHAMSNLRSGVYPYFNHGYCLLDLDENKITINRYIFDKKGVFLRNSRHNLQIHDGKLLAYNHPHQSG